MLYCGTAVGPGGTLVGDANTAEYCLPSAGGGLIPGLKAIGVNPEIVLNSGTNNVSDYRLIFANATA